MNSHQHYEELLPLYVAHLLNEPELFEMENHLVDCAECQADLAMWKAVSTEINTANSTVSAPPALTQRAIAGIPAQRSLAGAFLYAWQFIRAQISLVQQELWAATALVMAMGVMLALLIHVEGVMYFIAPMVAAAGLAVIYGPEEDSIAELTLATPTSPWKILLARVTLVSGYNLVLALAASAVLAVFIPVNLFWSIVLTWLGPLTFLSALALVLSLWIGTGNAVLIAYGLWVAQHVPIQSLDITPKPVMLSIIFSTYQGLWNSTPLLLTLAIILIGIALVSVGKPAGRLHRLSV